MELLGLGLQGGGNSLTGCIENHSWKSMSKSTLSLLDVMGNSDKLALMRWEENSGS